MTSANENFYGNVELENLTYLEFGSINLKKSKKSVWDFRVHQKAYDWLMNARYANDLVTYHKLSETLSRGDKKGLFELYKNELHHPDDCYRNLMKWVAISIFKDTHPSFLELGQTLFGCIDGIEFVNHYLNSLNTKDNLETKEVEWLGVDISDYFNRLAKITHSQHKVATFDSVDKLPYKTSVFFAKGVTLLYAISSAKQMLDTLNLGEIAVFDYSFSCDGIQKDSIGTGKDVCFIPHDSFLEEAKASQKEIYINKTTASFNSETNRLFADYVFGSKAHCDSFISAFKERESKIQKSKTMSEVFQCNQVSEWIPLQSYLNL
jgi:hypothetical protein